MGRNFKKPPLPGAKRLKASPAPPAAKRLNASPAPAEVGLTQTTTSSISALPATALPALAPPATALPALAPPATAPQATALPATAPVVKASENVVAPARFRPPPRVAAVHDMWTEKYRPARVSDVAGNVKAVVAVQQWVDKFKAGSVLLLLGPPGVGKTSVVLAALRPKWSVVEVNASDQTTGETLVRLVRANCRRRHAVVIDEADGMYAPEGGSERDFGMGEFKTCLANLPTGAQGKNMKLANPHPNGQPPVVLVANDGAPNHIKYIKNMKATTVVYFNTMFPSHMMQTAARVLRKEGLTCASNVLAKFAQCADGDMRQMLVLLQLNKDRLEPLSAKAGSIMEEADSIMEEADRRQTDKFYFCQQLLKGDPKCHVRRSGYAHDAGLVNALALTNVYTGTRPRALKGLPKDLQDAQDLQELEENSRFADIGTLVDMGHSIDLWEIACRDTPRAVDRPVWPRAALLAYKQPSWRRPVTFSMPPRPDLVSMPGVGDEGLWRTCVLSQPEVQRTVTGLIEAVYDSTAGGIIQDWLTGAGF